MPDVVNLWGKKCERNQTERNEETLVKKKTFAVLLVHEYMGDKEKNSYV